MTNVEKFQAQFIEEIQKNGIISVLEWIDSAYVKAATAELEDYYETGSDKLTTLDCVVRLANTTRNITNISTGHGSNMMANARIQAMAAVINRSDFIRNIQKERQMEIAECSSKKTKTS